MDTDRYLEPHQARRRPPTVFEDLLGDAIERAFTDGIHALPDLVNYLNQAGPSSENGEAWTEQNFQALMARLGN
ncbi:MAG: recombinase-like helix-turn-helix domain-containing protein [Rhodoferax sp.]